MKKVYKVEIRGQRQPFVVETMAEAKAVAISMTAWSGGAYRITPIYVAEEATVEA